MQPVAAPGEEADGACTITPTVPRQAIHHFMKHKFFAFHSTILHTNRGQVLELMAPEGRILKANFQKFSGGNTPDPLRATPFRTYRQYNLLLCAGLKPPVLGPRPSCPWCPTCAPVRTTSWRRHCLEQDRHGPFTSVCPPFSQLFIIARLLSFPSLPLLLEVGTL